MKKMLITICLIVLAVVLSGCAEYATGFGSGVATMKIMSDEAQENFIAAVNELNATTALIEGEVEGIALPTVKPETIAAIESLKGRKEDPITWIAFASLLANAFWGGSAYKRKVLVGTP